ncbi:hypothetical protein I4U23_023838 [Adineta vaga]|nr:hypothetical protein I4U23_023838 [Adineta vaga]
MPATYGFGGGDMFMSSYNTNDYVNGNNGTTFTFNGNSGTLLNGNNALQFQFNGNPDTLLNGANTLAFHFTGNPDTFLNSSNAPTLPNTNNAIALRNGGNSDSFLNACSNLLFSNGNSNDGFFGNNNSTTFANSNSAPMFSNGNSNSMFSNDINNTTFSNVNNNDTFLNGGPVEQTLNNSNVDSFSSIGSREQFLNGIHTEIFLNENNGNISKRDSQLPALSNTIEPQGFIGAPFTNNNDYGTTTTTEKPTSTTTNYPTDSQGLFQDPSPQLIRRPALGAPQVYTQRVIVKFLQPPPIQASGPLIIKEVRAPQPPPPPPLFIRQRPPPPPMLPPLIIREAPPKLPPLGPQIITKMLPPLPVPPRSVIIERLPPLPPRPRDVIVERWLPYRTLQKRRVIIQRAPPAVIPKPRNIIIYYEPAKAQIVRRFQNLGIAPANPDEYVARYGAQLEDAQTLVSHARQAGVVEDISPPISMRTSLQSSTGETGETSDGALSTIGNDLSEGNSLAGAGFEMVNSNVGGVGSSTYDSISTNNTLGRTSGSAGDLESSFGSFGFADNASGFGAANNYFDSYSSQHSYKLLRKAQRVRQLNIETNSKQKIDIYHEAAEACRSIGDYDQAIIYFNLELHESVLANLSDDILYCHRFLGECYLYKNSFHTSEKYQLNFLSLSKIYGNNERIEQAYTCLSNTYWLWLSYIQDDILYDIENDPLPHRLCKQSLEAAENSLSVIDKLDWQLENEIREKRLVKMKNIEEKQQDFALRRVRSYINIANALCEIYINDNTDNESLKSFSQYIKKAVELAKKYHLYQELARLHSSLSCFYLSVPNYLQYKKEILATMQQAIHYSRLTKNAHDYLSCLYDIAQTLVSFDDYENAKMYLLKIYQYKNTDSPIKEKAMQDLANVQRILTGLEDRYEKEVNLRKKMSLAEKCADTFSSLCRNEQSKHYYLKQLKHAQELDLDEEQMATIYSSLGSICQDLKEWQLSIDYFRREMSCRIGFNVNADIEQGYSLCEIIKCQYRLKLDLQTRINTFQRVLTIARSTNNKSLIRMAIALVFAMKLRDSNIHLNDDLETFMINIQPPINEENYSDILRCSERCANELIPSETDQLEDENSTLNNICYSKTRLHLACKEKVGLKKVIQLITEGDDINLFDSLGWTPLHIAIDHECIDIVRYLLDRKANINTKTNNGITPMIIACHRGYFDIIEILLTYGARIDLRTNNGYTAVDYLLDCDKNMSLIDQRKFNRLKELLLIAMKKDEPMYCIQSIVRSDFDDKQMILTNINHSIPYKTNRTDGNMITNKRLRQNNKKNKFSIVKHEKWDYDDDSYIMNDFQTIETISKPQREQLQSPSYTPAQKRRCSTIDNDLSSSDDIEILNIDDLDFVTPFQKDQSISSLQLITPKSTTRSRRPSVASSINTPIILSPPISYETNTRIIRCIANIANPIDEDKKLRIPISSTETITTLRYQVLKRLYDNYNIYACFVILYDKQDWELGMSESDTIQLAIPVDESDNNLVVLDLTGNIDIDCITILFLRTHFPNMTVYH